ncbi:MAG: hypothetical protein HFJ55_00790 [Clostridia bacterium]|nr:hypothetical protein [Clostridia bacterium]
MRNTRGITLIALVVTLIVLLILAGVSISMLTGDNGILKNAKKSVTETKLGEIEEAGGIIHNDLLIKKYQENLEREITIGDIANGLEKEGYEIKSVQLTQDAITGIEIEEATNGKIILAVDERKELTINPITSNGGYAYYVVVEGKNYEIKLENGSFKVNREPQNIEEQPTTNELEVTILKGETVSAEKHEEKEKTIVLQAGKTAGETIIKVTYGGKMLEITAIVKIIPPENAEEDIEGVTFITDYGKIDIIWLEGTSNIPSNTPNSPANYLSGMTPVGWDGTSETSPEAKNTNNSWYKYEPKQGTEENLASRWANAKTANGSYFVWIPRYAYRITYYDKDFNVDKTAQITGYYDGHGMWRESDGELKCKLDVKKDNSGNEIKDENGKTIDLIETVDYNGEKYIVHPAFTTSLDVGGWNENLPGFWIAKFEMSSLGNGTSDLRSVPGVTGCYGQLIGKYYTMAREATYGMTEGLNTDTDGNNSFMYSHMLKNSEWGATAYLAHSSYGRNAHEIEMNSFSYYNSFYNVTSTGGGRSATSYTKNQLQSTTGNVYGVYDMAGGWKENVAAWNTKITNTEWINNGGSFAKKNGTSTKYATSYVSTTLAGSGTLDVYKICKIGDGIKEVAGKGNYNLGWFSDNSGYVDVNNTYFARGGNCVSGMQGGVFNSTGVGGTYSEDSGFRTVLCP